MTARLAGSAPLRRGTVLVFFTIITLIWGSTWIVIRDQLGVVPAHWSVAYRFIIATVAMAAFAQWQGAGLRLPPGAWKVALVFGLFQFCVNFNAVYLAEHHVTSGLVACVFALLLIPNSLLAWAWTGHRPSRSFILSAIPAVGGIALLFWNEVQSARAPLHQALLGIGLTLVGVLGASVSNVLQTTPRARSLALPTLLTWGMGFGALCNIVVAVTISGAPVFDPRPGYWIGLAYLAVFASALAFSLYMPIIRTIGPGRAAYSSVIVPIIAMGLSTLFEGYRWTWLAGGGAALAIAGMIWALASAHVGGGAAVPPAETTG
jgi:drug/metabolite transporter (DMT)-like permease